MGNQPTWQILRNMGSMTVYVFYLKKKYTRLIVVESL